MGVTLPPLNDQTRAPSRPSTTDLRRDVAGDVPKLRLEGIQEGIARLIDGRMGTVGIACSKEIKRPWVQLGVLVIRLRSLVPRTDDHLELCLKYAEPPEESYPAQGADETSW